MNKKFLQTAAVAMGLTAFGLPLTGCNMGTNNTTPQRTGIVERQQYGSPIRYSHNGYERIDTLLDNDRTSPLPGNGVNLNYTTPLPGAVIGTTPALNADNVNDMRSKSRNIERQVETVKNVKDANVMVVGNTALVACNPSSTNVDTTDLRTAITQKIKSVDPSITNVVVTESANVMASMNKMFSNMSNKSMTQITQDFNNMIKQITPSVS